MVGNIRANGSIIKCTAKGNTNGKTEGATLENTGMIRNTEPGLTSGLMVEGMWGNGLTVKDTGRVKLYQLMAQKDKESGRKIEGSNGSIKYLIH